MISASAVSFGKFSGGQGQCPRAELRAKSRASGVAYIKAEWGKFACITYLRNIILLLKTGDGYYIHTYTHRCPEKRDLLPANLFMPGEAQYAARAGNN
ncbi:hypothetical protein WH47_03679 [Habropoda laboriosa]|uniref:Uncharacterized protein n=1 Tax=Habropoda laboriosa TaxID=597456 RepID=A0A0L7RIN4_9HYME|nr:hypothetical protein WH47_03679 [Habropoda laboriosa]